LQSAYSVVVILDASGIKICGEEEGKVKVYGKERPRKRMQDIGVLTVIEIKS